MIFVSLRKIVANGLKRGSTEDKQKFDTLFISPRNRYYSPRDTANEKEIRDAEVFCRRSTEAVNDLNIRKSIQMRLAVWNARGVVGWIDFCPWSHRVRFDFRSFRRPSRRKGEDSKLHN